MDSIVELITQLFSYIPEKWRPVAAFILLVLYVVTKARSRRKTKKINKLDTTATISAAPVAVVTASASSGGISSPVPVTFSANLAKEVKKEPKLMEQVIDFLF
jgi:cytochrome c oxidase assembly factor CtaG